MRAIADWDAAYSNRGVVPAADAIIDAWPGHARRFRETARGETDIPYGPGARERFDLFLPSGAPAGLVVYIHGGYWKAFDKDASSHLARGPLARGWAVAIPSYPLCPEARIAEITAAVGRAIAAAAARVGGPLVVTGHSAGGHLAARMVCRDGPLPATLRERLVRVLGISGVYDLRPIRRTAMNEVLRIDRDEALAESPALLEPIDGPEVIAWVGAVELPEFRRQNALLANVWTGLGARIEAFEAPRRHHFDVIEPLADPDSALVDRLLGANHHGL